MLGKTKKKFGTKNNTGISISFAGRNSFSGGYSDNC